MHKALAGSLSFPQLLSFLFEPVELRLVAFYFLKDRLKKHNKQVTSKRLGGKKHIADKDGGLKNTEMNTGDQECVRGSYFSRVNTL